MRYLRRLFSLLVLLFLTGFVSKSYAQLVPDTALTQPIPDVVRAKADTTVNADSVIESMPRPTPFEPKPKKAGLYSAIVPGAGQVYNRQYWKVPIVLAGVGTIAYFFQDNLQLYQSYRRAYLERVQDPNNTTNYPLYTGEQLKQLQDNYRKNLDLTALFGALVYAAQILDAVTSAHLKNFDISRDISMNMRPVVNPGGIGVGLVMNFK